MNAHRPGVLDLVEAARRARVSASNVSILALSGAVTAW
jgi:hypothetical protein